jgi:uncharacterized membrane protein (DUF4010 family)
MGFNELLSRTALALGIGLLIGLERGWDKRAARPGSRTAGVRTFAISGLLGGIAAALAQGSGRGLSTGGSIVLAAAFVAYAGAIAMFSRDENRANHTYSATTMIAALLTFMLGAYALLGEQRVAAASAIAAAGVLIVRQELHEWIKKITLAELQSALVLLAMTFIALPIFPDRSVGPFGGVNLREVWIIAIVLASVSFVGYVAVKFLGERHGVLIAAATGGLVSSTAVTLANARRAGAGEGQPRLLAAGAALATAVSFVRVIAIVAALKPTLLPLIAPALLASSIVATGFAVVSAYWRSGTAEKQTAVAFRNPFGFWSVIGLAVSVGVLIVIGRWIYDSFGAVGAIGGAAAMGLFDVDAMTISMSRLVPQPLDPHGASYAILAGVASNTFSKVVIGAFMGRGQFALAITVVSCGCVLAGWLTLLATLALLAPV